MLEHLEWLLKTMGISFDAIMQRVRYILSHTWWSVINLVYYRCFPHVINISAQGGIKTLSKVDDPSVEISRELQADPAYKSALKQDVVVSCRTLVNSCRASGQRQDDLLAVIVDGNERQIFGDAGLRCVRLCRDMDVRWSSTLLMIDRALELYPVRIPQPLTLYLLWRHHFRRLSMISSTKPNTANFWSTNLTISNRRLFVMFASGCASYILCRSLFRLRRHLHYQSFCRYMRGLLVCSRKLPESIPRLHMQFYSLLRSLMSIWHIHVSHAFMQSRWVRKPGSMHSLLLLTLFPSSHQPNNEVQVDRRALDCPRGS